MNKDWKWLIPIVIYFAGIFFIPSANIDLLKSKIIANQEEYYYTDSEGEEYEGESLTEIQGIGKMLTYKDIYLASIPMLFFSAIFAEILYGGRKEMECMMFGNCVLGILLIWLTSQGTIVSTILFWLGIFAAGFANKKLQN